MEGLNLWRNTSAEINDEQFKGFREGNTEGKLNEVLAGYSLRFLEFIVSRLDIPAGICFPLILFSSPTAYDFLDTSGEIFNVNIQYNSTYEEFHLGDEPQLLKILRAENMVYLYTFFMH